MLFLKYLIKLILTMNIGISEKLALDACPHHVLKITMASVNVLICNTKECVYVLHGPTVSTRKVGQKCAL
jgi:hypothetical protein